MEFFDFIQGDELDDLPAEDPPRAFIEFVRIAEPRLKARLAQLTAQDFAQLEDARYGFQNVVLGAARQFGIEPFASLQMPMLQDYQEQDYRQFRADLTHYITQIMLTTSYRDRGDSVPLPSKVQDNIRSYIHHLRAAIDEGDFTESRRAALHRRLDALEAELARKRVRFLVVARVIIEVLAIPGALGASYDVVARLTSNILHELGEAKLNDDQNRPVIPQDQPVALLPPRSTKVESPSFSGQELDDEIPF